MEEQSSTPDLTTTQNNNLGGSSSVSPSKNNSLRKRDSSQIKRKKEIAVRQNLGGKAAAQNDILFQQPDLGESNGFNKTLYGQVGACKSSPKKQLSQKRVKGGLGSHKESILTGSTSRLPPKLETDGNPDSSSIMTPQFVKSPQHGHSMTTAQSKASSGFGSQTFYKPHEMTSNQIDRFNPKA